MNQLRSLFYRVRRKALWLTIAIFVLSANWAANIIQDSIKVIFEGRVEISPIGLSYVIFFFAMSYLLYKSIFNPFPRTRYMNDVEHPEKRSHLVIFLSKLENTKSLVDGIPSWLILTGDFKKDFETLVEHKTGSTKRIWKWEMPLRAIGHHIGTLENVIVLCSSESISQYSWFLKILGKYNDLSGINILVLVKKDNRPFLIKDYDEKSHLGWDFMKFDEMSKALGSLIKELFKKGIREKDIMIDFTGGLAVTSVVAAAISFNRKIKAQYVKTNPEWEVVSYDIVFESSRMTDFDFTA